MGLAVSTHALAYLIANDAEGATALTEDIALVNKLLAANELPAHTEPSEARTPRRPSTTSFPYSFLHYLRRAFAHVREDVELTPLAEGESPTDDETVDEASEMFDTHLLCHSDAEGYYVPIDFNDVIFDVDNLGLAGGSLGSTQRLRDELIETAIGISLDDGELSDELAAAIHAEADTGPYWRERLVWLALFEAARVSLADKTMIVFS